MNNRTDGITQFAFNASMVVRLLLTKPKRACLVALSLVAFISQPAQAACSVSGPVLITTMNNPTELSFSDTAPLLTVLWSGSIFARSPHTYTCTDARDGWLRSIAFTGSATAYSNIYTTGYPGIGIRVHMIDYLRPWNLVSYQPFGRPTSGSASANVTVELIKIGNIASGYMTFSGPFATWVVASQNGTLVRPLLYMVFHNLRMGINIRRPTCTLANRAPSIDFGTLSVSNTNGMLAQRTFNVSIQCSGGSAGQTRPVRITFTDALNTGNRGRDLTVQPADSGMTVNLQRNTTDIYFGPASNAAGNPGQFLLGTEGNGLFNYPITARLMRIDTMRPLVTFTAQATMTMRYE